MLPLGDRGTGPELTAERAEQLLAEDLVAIQDKVQRKIPLTDAEVRRIKAVARGGDTLTGWMENQQKLSEALGCDRRTIQRLLKIEGNPGKRSDGRYPLAEWKKWTSEHGRLRKGSVSSDKEALETQALILRNERLELDLAERRGELMGVEEVNKVLTDMMGAFVQGIRGLKHSLSPQVVGMTVPEASKRIALAVDEQLSRLSLGEWAKKKVFWSAVYAHLRDLHKSCSLGDGPSEILLSP